MKKLIALCSAALLMGLPQFSSGFHHHGRGGHPGFHKGLPPGGFFHKHHHMGPGHHHGHCCPWVCSEGHRGEPICDKCGREHQPPFRRFCGHGFHKGRPHDNFGQGENRPPHPHDGPGTGDQQHQHPTPTLGPCPCGDPNAAWICRECFWKNKVSNTNITAKRPEK